MADRITQIQDCLEQLLTQMYATIRYIDTRHSYASITGQADQFTNSSELNDTQTPTQAGNTQEQPQEQALPSGSEPLPDPPVLFQSRMQELAQDLVIKEQQIEALVAALPGVGNSQEAQEKRLEELQRELETLEEDAKQWDGEKFDLIDTLESKIGDVTRI